MSTPMKAQQSEVVDVRTPEKGEIINLVSPSPEKIPKKAVKKSSKKASKKGAKFDRSKLTKGEKLAVMDNNIPILCTPPCGAQMASGKFTSGTRVGKDYLRCLLCPTFLTVKHPIMSQASKVHENK